MGSALFNKESMTGYVVGDVGEMSHRVNNRGGYRT
jgi:hypothetical protein